MGRRLSNKLIRLAVMILALMASNIAKGESWGSMDYIRQYETDMKAMDKKQKTEFQSFSNDLSNTENDVSKDSVTKKKVQDTVPYYDSQAKESQLTEHQLRGRGQESQMIAGVTKDKEIENEEDASIRGEKSAIKFRQESYLRKKRYKNKDLTDVTTRTSNKGEAPLDVEEVIQNPLIGLNKDEEKMGIDSECKVGDATDNQVKPKLEPYEAEVDDVREIETKGKCEEDESEVIFQCDRILKRVDCDYKYSCSFSDSGTEGGLYTSASNSDFMSASGGLSWGYNGEILFFGNDNPATYGKDWHDTGDGCHSKNFTARFFIKDSSQVSKFEITEVFENNVMNIRVNGYLVYEGERYGRAPVAECDGAGPRYCWLNACDEHWKSHYVDLKGKIREGWNDVDITLWYTRIGHAGLKIRAKQYCCGSWSDKWEDDCPVN